MPWWKHAERLLNAYGFFIGSLVFGFSGLFAVLEFAGGELQEKVVAPGVWGGVAGMVFGYSLASPPPGGLHERWLPAYVAALLGGMAWFLLGLGDDQLATDRVRLTLAVYFVVPFVTRVLQLGRIAVRRTAARRAATIRG